MSRLIKFRAWDKDFEMMFYSNSSDDPLNVTGERIHHLCGCEKPEGHLNYFFFEKAPIMQFTGLNDCHGKEIYEGDILKRNNSPCYKVLFADGSYRMNGKSKDGSFEFKIKQDKAGLMEVIGNVYENPELLV